MKKLVVSCVLVLAMSGIVSADTFGTGANQFDIDFVHIANAGNAADSLVMNDGTTGYGAVGYDYRISKYEVTNAQWDAFTAAVGAPTGNPSNAYDQSATHTDAQQPTDNASWYEALQFCNYLTTGDKSQGVYQFSGNNANPGNFLSILDHETAGTVYETAYYLPTEDEWFKAAYYKPDDSGYSLYANGTDTVPTAGIDTNYGDIYTAPWAVGTGTEEQNGTYDMMGNVREWNETWIVDSYYGLRGGSFDIGEYILARSLRGGDNQDFESQRVGFRVASVPEPTTLSLLALGTLVLRRRRR